MSDSGISFLMGFAVGLLLVWLTYGTTSTVYKNQAIEAGCAVYDAKTGKWGWIKGGDAE